MRQTIIIGLVTVTLLTMLTIQLLGLPTFMFPPLYLTIMLLTGLILFALIISLLARQLFKKQTFLKLFLISTSVLSGLFISYLYKPTKTIVVQSGYIGQVHLVLADIDENILTLDSNGIGYINKWTFNRTFTPKVIQDNNDITDRCVGFNPSSFWGISTTSFPDSDKKLKSLTFEIVPDDKKGIKQYYHTDITKLVDRQIVREE